MSSLKKKVERVVTRAREFFDRQREQSTHVVEFTRLEEAFLRHHIGRWPKFEELALNGEAIYPPFRDFLTDVFFDLFLYEPKWREPGDVRASHRGNMVLMQQAHSLPMYRKCREHSALNRLNTMLAVVYVAEAVLQVLPDLVKNVAPGLDEGDLREFEDGLSDMTDEEIEQMMNNLQSQLDAIDGSTMNEDDARRAMRSGLSQAHDNLEEFEQVVKTWGTDPGTLQNLPPQEVFDLYEKMRGIPHFKSFTDEIGRQRLDAIEATKHLYAREPHEIVDVKTGSNLADLVPSERMAFGDEFLETVFWMNYLQDGVLNWAYEGREDVGKGPIIICSDVSGSTMGAPERWGKAFSLAAIDFAARQKRDLAIVYFSSDVEESGIFILPGGRADLHKKVEIASYYLGGGTNFVPPLTVALKAIEDYEGDWKEADVVLLTDGQFITPSVFVEDYRARTTARGVRTHGVLLQGSEGMIKAITPLCDRVVSIRSLTESPRPLFTRLAS